MVAIFLTLLFFLVGGVFSHAVSISHPASDLLVRAETLIKLSHPSGAVGNSGSYYYGYDYRSRRVVRDERYASGRFKSVLTFSGGLSVTETLMNEIHDFYEDPDQDGRTNFYEYAFGGDPLSGWTASNYTPPFPVSGYHEWAIASISARVSAQTIINHRENSVVLKEETIRGSDMGGGVGGVLYSLRGGQRQFNSYNSRGDVVNTSNDSGNNIWQAQYEALGTRTAESGPNTSRQRANTKDEDPTGLLNEGFRYRDLETGIFITRDPLGFVDGPNVYTYVVQNPWTMWDPEGLSPAFMMHPPQTAWDPAIRNMVNSPEYQEGYKKGMATGAVVGTVVTVGVVVTVYTGGAAGPAVASAASSLGLSSSTASVTTAAIAGGMGSMAANTTSNVLTGQSPLEGNVEAGLTGAAFGAAGQVLGNTALAFRQGVAEGTGLAEKARQAANAARAGTQGVATGTVSADGNVTATAISTGAARTAEVAPGTVSAKVQAAANTTPANVRPPYHLKCAEPRAATALEAQGGSTRGAVSASVVVKNGAQIPGCPTCTHMNRNLGILDVNATEAGPSASRAASATAAAANSTDNGDE